VSSALEDCEERMLETVHEEPTEDVVGGGAATPAIEKGDPHALYKILQHLLGEVVDGDRGDVITNFYKVRGGGRTGGGGLGGRGRGGVRSFGSGDARRTRSPSLNLASLAQSVPLRPGAALFKEFGGNTGGAPTSPAGYTPSSDRSETYVPI
jgi:hypothetical protein